MVLYVSIFLLAASCAIAILTRTLPPRIYAGGTVLVWLAYVLYFQFEGHARLVAREAAEQSLTADPFVAGVLAYKDAIFDLRVSIFLVALTLFVLTLARRSTPSS